MDSISAISTIWTIIFFLICLTGYLAFSVTSRDALSHLAFSLERRESYRLPPISTVFPDPERFVSILNFCRLLFILPLVILLYKHTSTVAAITVYGVILALIMILFLLPMWLRRRGLIEPCRKIAQGAGWLLYPLFLIMANLSERGRAPQTIPEFKKEKVGEAESKEFKVDILRAINMIEDTTVREVMAPRVDMVCISSTATLEELHQSFKEHKFSRLPVYKDKIDSIVGIVNVIDLVSSMPNLDRSAPVETIMRPALFVPETKKVFTLLRELRESHAQMAIVIDEYGGTSGLVTLEDLLEELVGEIQDEFDEAGVEGLREKDGSYIVTGKFPIERMEEVFSIHVQGEDFETISGLIFSLLGRIPIVGEVIHYQNLNLEIVEADKRRIHRVRIRELPKQENAQKV